MGDTCREHARVVRGVRMASCSWGSVAAPAARTLVCLHGWQDNAWSFRALGEAVAAAGADWQLTALDLPGHGLSDHLPAAQFYNLWDYVSLVIDWLRADTGPVWLCGHSMGGMIASVLAAVRPDLVRGLVTLDMFGLATDDSPTDQVSRLVRVLREQTEPVAVSRPSPDLAHAVARRQRFGSPATAAANQHLVERGAAETAAGWAFRLDPRVRLGSVMRLTTEQVIALGGMIHCPWHAILGKQGMFSQRVVQRGQMHWPQARVHWWPGNHHFHMESAPEALWNTMRGLLQAAADELEDNQNSQGV